GSGGSPLLQPPGPRFGTASILSLRRRPALGLASGFGLPIVARYAALSTILDYRTPQPPPPDPERVALLRMMAGVLAFGATLWAIFCAAFIIFGSWRALLIFG